MFYVIILSVKWFKILKIKNNILKYSTIIIIIIIINIIIMIIIIIIIIITDHYMLHYLSLYIYEYSFLQPPTFTQ